ncbi:MAG: hypothetical protein QOK15_3328 [Nocardioidaceae bacterium]|jgi:hypothetical protein|nr:hypothetical protein [Nocardioidaceae bacterium]
MAEDKVSDELWNEFHRVVNMTSRELNEWMRTQSSGEEAEALPEDAGTSLGHRVVGILAKRRSDLTDDDVAAMTKVVDLVHRERRDDLEPTAGDDHWRHKLMSIGHDPLKPATT